MTKKGRFFATVALFALATSFVLFGIPALAQTGTFTNNASIAVPGANASGPASPYPSNVAVNGLTGDIEDVNVTLRGVSHTNPDDIDVLLVAPNGENVLLMADVGGAGDLDGVNLTFDDEAAGELPNSTQITSGTYQPSKGGSTVDTFPNSGEVAPFGTELSEFDGEDPNGQWKLYIRDDEAQNVGQIARGYSITIETNNDAPVINSAEGDTVDEGSNATITVNAADADDDTLTYDFDCNADGDYTDAGDEAGSTDNTGSCTFDDDGTYQVPVRVTDDDNATDTDTATVTVENVAPTATLSNDGPIDEGESVTVTFSEQEDPSEADTNAGFRYEYQCDGSFDGDPAVNYATASQSATFECDYDESGSQTVAARIIDKDNGFTTETTDVTVNNVDPTIDSFTADPNPVDEGSETTLTATASDPGDEDLTYAFDCDVNSGGGYVENDDNTSVCEYGDQDTYTAGVQVTDGDGGTDTETVQITVNNVSPTVQITGPNAADEGDTATYSYTVTEPGDDPIVPDTQCGVNGVEDEDSNEYDPQTGEGSFDCTFPDGPANSEVSVSVDDGDGGDASDSIIVQVANVAPQFDLTGDATANEGQIKTYTYTVEDPGNDTLGTVEESCGVNATYTDTATPNSFDCTFTDGGEGKFSNVSVSASDSDGAESSDSIRVDVVNVKPSVTLTGPTTTDEGETETYEFEVTDPGTTDTHTAVAACGDDGELVTDSLTYSNQSREGSFDCFFPNGDETTNVTVRVTDSDGAQDTDNRVVEVTVDNVPPVISDIEDQTIQEDGTTGPIPFTVEDVDADTVEVTAASSNQDLVQNSDITLGGSGENRTVTVTPDANESGTTTITITADDGTERSTETFVVTVEAVNDAPVADDASQTVSEDGANATFDLGALVSDQETADADIEYEIVTGPTQAQGTASISDQTLTFDPADNFNGTVTITYSATDEGGLSDEGTLTITVTPVNDAPVANDDTRSTPEDTPLVIQSSSLTANDTTGADNENQTLTITEVSNAENGTVELSQNGQTVTFTPDANYTGPASFDYTVCDNGTPQRCSVETATVNVTVESVNDEPVAEDDSYSVQEDGTLVADGTPPGVLANDTDADDTDLTVLDSNPNAAGIQPASGPENGTLELNADGTFTYTPDDDFNGTDTFTYRATDGEANSDLATVTITVRAENDAPVANDDGDTNDRLAVEENGSRLIDVLANDTDADDDDLTIQSVGNPANGDAEVEAGQIRYTPDDNYNGPDQFTYTVSDGNGGTDTATVFINVTPINSAPVANDDDETVAEDGANATFDLGALVTDQETADAQITYEIVAGPTQAQGTASIAGQTLTYNPADNFNGEVTITYRATDDGDGAAEPKSDTGTLTVTVTAVNDAPIARDDTRSTPEDTPLTFNVFSGDNPLANDVEVDRGEAGATLTVSSFTQPDNGTVNCTPGGDCTYTPDANFSGQDSFTYTVRDNAGATDSGTITVNIEGANDAPTARPDTITTQEDTASGPVNVIANDSDPDGDTVEFAGFTQPQNGTASCTSAGVCTYTPNANFNGSDSFTYTVRDSNGQTSTGTVNVTVSPVNDAPVANNDTKTGAVADQPFTFPASDLTANDTDADGDNLTVTAVGNPTNGTVTLNNGQITFTGTNPGPASFDYTVSDGNGGTDTGTVNLTVGDAPPPNTNPDAVNDSATTNEDTAVTINVLANDTDADDDDLAIQSVGNPPKGTATISNGRVRYTPDANATGTDTFAYTVSDGNGGTDTATVTVAIRPVNDAPVARNDSAQTRVNTAVNVRVLANDRDIDGGTLRVTTFTQPGKGKVTRGANGTLRFTPDRNFVGTTRFTYTISDGKGGTSRAAVTITVRR